MDLFFIAVVLAVLIVVCMGAVEWYVLAPLRFRRLFKKCGITFEEALAKVRQDEGVLVCDHALGPSQGLKSPTVWWIPPNSIPESGAQEKICWILHREAILLTDFNGGRDDFLALTQGVNQECIAENNALLS